MGFYKYVAKNKQGKTISGNLEADDVLFVKDFLRGKGLTIVSLVETEMKQKGGLFSRKSSKKVKVDDIVVFSRQLATMINSGIPIVTSLDILGEQLGDTSLGKVLVQVKEMIEGGSNFSDAIARYPKIFSTLFISMVRAGEASGKLDEIMERLAIYLEKNSALQKKIKSAMIYPAVVSVLAIVITLVMIIWVIPVFEDIFSNFDAQLPLPTQILIVISDLVRSYFLIFACMIAGGIFALKQYIQTTKGRLQFDTLTLRLPVFGALFTKVGVSKFTRTLGTLIKSGIPMLTAIEIVGKASGNTAIENVLKDVYKSVREGEGIATPLSRSAIFPPMVVRMVQIGEKSGELEQLLSKISDFYDEQVDIAVNGLTSLIEPLIIAFLGIVIGGIVICMFLPIFQLSTIIQM